MSNYNKMNPQLKKRWVKALRIPPDEGGHKQGKGVLVDNDDRFCCLGVLCNIMLRDHHDWGWEKRREWGFVTPTDSAICVLPDEVQKEAGLSQSAMDYLMMANDNGEGFTKIAYWIEENL